MADSEQSPGQSPALDLHAQIQARIAERRARPEVAGAAGAAEAAGVTDAAGATGVAGAGRRQHPITRGLRALAVLLAVAVVVAGLRTFVVASYYIPSASMETTLHGCTNCQPDMVLVDKLSYRFAHVARTDVVVFDRPPLAPPADKELIKRVIGLPGETVSGHGGRVFIGDKALDEPYLDQACHGTGDFAPVKVPAGEYFMMGDNRCNSFDSRIFGPVPRASIVGRSVAVIWPAKHLRWL